MFRMELSENATEYQNDPRNKNIHVFNETRHLRTDDDNIRKDMLEAWEACVQESSSSTSVHKKIRNTLKLTVINL